MRKGDVGAVRKLVILIVRQELGQDFLLSDGLSFLGLHDEPLTLLKTLLFRNTDLLHTVELGRGTDPLSSKS